MDRGLVLLQSSAQALPTWNYREEITDRMRSSIQNTGIPRSFGLRAEGWSGLPGNPTIEGKLRVKVAYKKSQLSTEPNST
jgi:hypothetical protein